MMSPASRFRTFEGRLYKAVVCGDCLVLTLHSKHDLFDGAGEYSHTDELTRDYWVFPGPLMDKAKALGLPSDPPLCPVRMSGVTVFGSDAYMATDIGLAEEPAKKESIGPEHFDMLDSLMPGRPALWPPTSSSKEKKDA